MKEPADLDFTLKLLSVEQPEDYKKEAYVKSCQDGPRQGQAGQLSKSKNKTLATTYKPFC